MKKILITGASGFLGSSIVGELIKNGYKVSALKRSKSDLWRCADFIHNVNWIDCDNLSDVESEIINYEPNILIHSAWGGVKSYDRENWIEQEKNLSFFVYLLEVSKRAGIKKIVALGSQAEYGTYKGVVDEFCPCNPNSAYGTIKLCAYTILKSFALENEIDWYWIRLFSIFGPGEDKNWLIPSVIENLLGKKEMKLTGCDQKYDYLYLKDFTSGIMSLINCSKSKSGVYNLSSGTSISIKEILIYLESRLSPDKKLLEIGALPYRSNQIMHMEGNSELFFRSFNFSPIYKISVGLEETLNYYLMQKKNDKKK